MKTTILTLVLLACVMPVAFAQKLLQHKDNFSNATQYFTESREVKLERGSFLTGRYVHFNFTAFHPILDPQHPYGLHVSSTTSDWVFISAGPSLLLKLDGGQMLALSGAGSVGARTVLTANSLQEDASWWMTESQFKQLAQAKTVEFRILGDKQILTGEWKPDLLRDLVYFASEIPKYIQPEAPLIAALIEEGKAEGSLNCPPVERPAGLGAPVKLGIKFVAVNPKIAELTRFDGTSGIFVMEASAGGAAVASGIKAGDILTQVAGTPVADRCAVFAVLAKTPGDAPISLSMWSQGSGHWTANLTPQAASTSTQIPASAEAAPSPPDLYTELTKLDELRKKGLLSEDEFNAQKQKLLNSR